MTTRHEDGPRTARLPIERLLAPRSVALVGASPDPATLGGAVLANFERFGFVGELHLVSRRHARIAGRPCVPGLDDLPEALDAVVLVIGESAVLDAVVQCVRRGAKSAVVFAAGFAEVGGEGVQRQARSPAITHSSKRSCSRRASSWPKRSTSSSTSPQS